MFSLMYDFYCTSFLSMFSVGYKVVKFFGLLNFHLNADLPFYRKIKNNIVIQIPV